LEDRQLKLDIKTNDYATNATVHGKFKVANNAVMQQILSKMLYSDPIKSLLRELSINAMEAHMEMGYADKPFDVILPTKINPEFRIRDYGPGLSKEALEDLYTTYGRSTKRESNDYTGGFGIGSKSPFAYTGMFEVASYHNGIKYIVENSKNAKDEFVYDILWEDETDEPDGLEISFKVQLNDIQKFSDKAVEVYKWFDVVPNITPVHVIKRPVPTDSGENWEILKGKTYWGDSVTSYVLAGQVAYPIDMSHFKGHAQSVLEHCGVLVKLNVGEVIVAPNRENLQYNEHTINVITAVLEELYQSVKEKAENAVKNCKSVWEARLLAVKFFQDNALINSVLGGKFTYEGVIYDSRSYLRDTNRLNLKYYAYSNGSVIEKRSHVQVDVHEDVQFAVYEDGGYAASRRYVTANPTVRLYVVMEDKKQDLIDKVGILASDLLTTSTFPAAVRQKRAKSIGNKVQAYRFNPQSSNHWDSRQYWKDEEIDLDNESGYYCPINRFDIVSGNGLRLNIGNIQDYLTGLTIVGVLESRKSRFEKHANWTNLHEFFKDKLDKLSTSKEITTYSKIIAGDSGIQELYSKRNSITNKNSDLYLHLEKMEAAKKAQDKVAEFNALQNFYRKLGGTDYKVTSPEVDLNFDLKKFPLLKHIPFYNYNKKEVLDYINLLNV
jgi:hypothetical protein